VQDKITQDVYEWVNKRGEIYITSTVVGGAYAIRVVSANPLAGEKNIRRAFDILVETTAEVRDGKICIGAIHGIVENGRGEGVGDVAMGDGNGAVR